MAQQSIVVARLGRQPHGPRWQLNEAQQPLRVAHGRAPVTARRDHLARGVATSRGRRPRRSRSSAASRTNRCDDKAAARDHTRESATLRFPPAWAARTTLDASEQPLWTCSRPAPHPARRSPSSHSSGPIIPLAIRSASSSQREERTGCLVALSAVARPLRLVPVGLAVPAVVVVVADPDLTEVGDRANHAGATG